MKNTCDLCDEVLKDPWFSLRAFRWVGGNVMENFQIRMCLRCYHPIHAAVKKAVHEVLKQRFQDNIARLGQAQSAEKI